MPDWPVSSTTSYAFEHRALLIAQGAEARGKAGEWMALAELRCVGEATFAGGAEMLATAPPADLLLVNAAEADFDGVAAIAFRAEALIADTASRVVFVLTPEQIDAAGALVGRATLLCAPSTGEVVAALKLALLTPANMLSASGRSSEDQRLQRLNEEVARFTETLARLTREEQRGGGLRDPGNGYRGEDAAESDIGAGDVRAIIRARRMRDEYFGKDLFADPAWDMVLDLFAAKLENRNVSVSSLCIAAAVPATTALRWIGNLHEAGLFERHADPQDRRRAYIALTDRAVRGMHGYIAAVRRAGLPLI